MFYIFLKWSGVNIIFIIEHTILIMLFTVFQSSNILLAILLVHGHFLSVSILAVVYLEQQLDEVCDSKVILVAQPVPNLEVVRLGHISNQELGVE